MIIIPTTIDRIDTWLKDCLESIETDRPVTVVFQGEKPPKGLVLSRPYVHKETGFDPGAIVWAMANLKPDEEFFVLHDSCVVHDNLLWKVLFDGYHEESVALSKQPVMMGMFLGKYRMKIASKIKPPIATTKLEAVELEQTWNNEYCSLEQPILLDSNISQSNIFEERHGRNNMVLKCRWLTKYKGTWNPNQL